MNEKFTPAPWRMATDAQGPCMIMHPTRKGVAIASLTSTFRPVNGFHEDWESWLKNGRLDEAATNARIAERNANGRLIAAAPDLLEACKVLIERWSDRPDNLLRSYTEDDVRYRDAQATLLARAAIAKATGDI